MSVSVFVVPISPTGPKAEERGDDVTGVIDGFGLGEGVDGFGVGAELGLIVGNSRYTSISQILMVVGVEAYTQTKRADWPRHSTTIFSTFVVSVTPPFPQSKFEVIEELSFPA